MSLVSPAFLPSYSTGFYHFPFIENVISKKRKQNGKNEGLKGVKGGEGGGRWGRGEGARATMLQEKELVVIKREDEEEKK